MPGILPGMQALTALTHFWLVAVLHALPVAELCVCLARLSAPMQGGGALVVGTAEVPLLGALNSMHHGAAVAGPGNPGLDWAAASGCRPCGRLL
jgi:hypothetical protein